MVRFSLPSAKGRLAIQRALYQRFSQGKIGRRIGIDPLRAADFDAAECPARGQVPHAGGHRALGVGHAAQRLEDRRGEHETAGVDGVPRLEAFGDGGHPIARPSHLRRIVEVEIARRSIDQHAAGLVGRERRRGEPGERHIAEHVIDHLQKELGRRERLGRKERHSIGQCRVGGFHEPHPQPGRQRLDRRLDPRSLVAYDDDGLFATARTRMAKRVDHERHPANCHERFWNTGGGASEPRAEARGENHGLGDGPHTGNLNTKTTSVLRRDSGAPRHVHVTFHGLANTSDPARGGTAPGIEAAPPHDRFERDTIEILKRLSRRPIDPGPQSELLADLGFDSLQVLELVGELEDHFSIAIPLNSLTHIRSVAEIAGEVRRLVAELEVPP